MKGLTEQIESSKIFAIVRGIDPDKMEPLFQALLDGGVKNIEITLNTKDALKSIEKMNRIFGRDMVIGAGTVVNEEMALMAIEAGARFLVSPNVDKGMISAAISNNVLPLPGAMTPTEISQAISYGAEIIKLFPASSLGAGYIKELKGPFDNLKVIAVGGISVDNVKEYIKVGAIGVGIGGGLVNKGLIEEGNFKAITKYATRLREIVFG